MLSPFAMRSAFPTPDYYEDSAPRRPHRQTMSMPVLLRGEGEDGVVPTFTVHRLTVEVPSYTPATSLRVLRRIPPEPAQRPWVAIVVRGRAIGLRLGQRCTDPYPPGWSRSTTEGASGTGSLRCTFPSRLRGNGVWQCHRPATLSGLLPARRPCRRSACPQLLGTAAPVPGGSRAPRGETAPRGAQPTSSMQSSLGWQ